MVQNMYLWFSLRNKDDFLLFFVFKVFRTSLEIQFLRDQLKINLKDFSFKVKDFKFKSITSKSQKVKNHKIISSPKTGSYGRFQKFTKIRD